MTPDAKKICQAGYTLIELLICVAILLVLSGVAVPGTQTTYEALQSTIATNLHSIATVIDVHKVELDGMKVPTASADWFTSLKHPQCSASGSNILEIIDVPGLLHPHEKTFTDVDPKAYWANIAENVVRARVRARGDITYEAANHLGDGEVDPEPRFPTLGVVCWILSAACLVTAVRPHSWAYLRGLLR